MSRLVWSSTNTTSTEKIQLRKQIKAHEERNLKSAAPNEPSANPLPQYLLDRSNPTSAKALSSAIKNKRNSPWHDLLENYKCTHTYLFKGNEKAAKFSVPLPKVRGISEEEMFKVVKTYVNEQASLIIKWSWVIIGYGFTDRHTLRQLPEVCKANCQVKLLTDD